MYGRLRAIAEVTAGRVGRFVSVGGVPAHRGWMNPWLYEPAGLPVPVGEDGPTVADEAEDQKGYRVARTEEAVFAHHPDAAHFRYPYAYGPYQLVPREWSIVRRILDGRRRIVVADDGLTLHHHGYTVNLAHAVLLAIDQPDAAAGQVFNAADEEVLTVRQVVELVAAALGHELELVSMPYDLAVPARPLLAQPLPTHRVLDLTRIRSALGYRDVVPAREAVAHTARWLADHPPARGAQEEMVLTDPFDYAAEDELMDAWLALRAGLPTVRFDPEPRYGLAYSGPGSARFLRAVDSCPRHSQSNCQLLGASRSRRSSARGARRRRRTPPGWPAARAGARTRRSRGRGRRRARRAGRPRSSPWSRPVS